jgi:hypothetical protein
MAGNLGLELHDLRSLERAMAEGGDFGDGDVRPVATGFSPLRSYDTWAMTSRQVRMRLEERILGLAARGNALLVGWSAAAVLRPFHHVARVCIRAPLVAREKVVMRTLGYAHPSTARLEIESRDALVARFMRRVFGQDWIEPDLHDLTLSMSALTWGECALILRSLVGMDRYRRSPETLAAILARMEALDEVAPPAESPPCHPVVANLRHASR